MSKRSDKEQENVLEKDVKRPLTTLWDEEKGSAFIGRKTSDFKKYGYKASVYLGEIAEKDSKKSPLFMDTLSPHVAFICGARGSGKSYSLGVVVEDLAKNNSNVGMIVIDPIGIYWSMKYPNRDKREIAELADWGLVPQGLDNLKVFIPEGAVSQVQGETYDEAFTIAPSLLTTDDWCLTFGVERFSPGGLLMEKVLTKVKQGYSNMEGEKVPAKPLFSLEDIINCLYGDNEINSAEKGFKKDSIRALVSRFDAARSWGVFSEKGTPLSQMSRPNQVTVLDISFLDEEVASLVIGIIARRVLSARKVYTRNEALTRLDSASVDKLLETDIPPTWLLIDEAHTLMPGGNTKTAASNALIEYVKQGRRPGCSLVFATQQPGAIDSQVLSQVDLMISHKLIFGDDIKAVSKRMPSIMPSEYMTSSTFRSLPIGHALIGDRREETSRVFLARIRPRVSQHEGRETQTLEQAENIQPVQVLNLISKLLENDLRKTGEEMPLEKVSDLLETLNSRYKLEITLKELLEHLEDNDFIVTETHISKDFPADAVEEPASEELIDGVEQELAEEVESAPELNVSVERGEEYCLVPELSVEQASKPSKSIFNLFKKREASAALKYTPLLEVKYSYTQGGKTLENAAFVDLQVLEFAHLIPGKGVQYSKGLSKISGLDEHAVKILDLIKKRKEATVDDIQGELDLGSAIIRTRLNSLEGKDLIRVDKNHKPHVYYLNREELDLPRQGEHLLKSLNSAGIERKSLNESEVREARVKKDDALKALENVFPEMNVLESRVVYLPYYEVVVDGKKREVHAFK